MSRIHGCEPSATFAISLTGAVGEGGEASVNWLASAVSDDALISGRCAMRVVPASLSTDDEDGRIGDHVRMKGGRVEHVDIDLKMELL